MCAAPRISSRGLTQSLTQKQTARSSSLRAVRSEAVYVYCTVTVTFVVADADPGPDAFTVMVRVVLVAFLDALTVIVVVPADVREFGENETDSPLLVPDAVNVTVPVTVPESVIVVLNEVPRGTVSEPGEAEIE